MKHLLLVLGLLPALSANAQTRKVLFIGNSYTYSNDLPNLLRQLALSMGDTITVASSAPGGYTFELHTTNATTQALIAQQAWDFVVLQEQSQIPSFPDAQVEQDCFPFAAQLVDSIRAHSPCAEAVFYMTWGRENGDAGNCPNWPPVCTYEGMQALLRERYLQMAFDNNAFAAPVGVAWKRTRELHPGIALYVGDGSHPSLLGSYLIASTLYSTIMRRSCADATFTAALPADTALILRTIATSTVLDSMAVWNIGVNDPDAAFTSEFTAPCTMQFQSNEAGTHTWSFGDGATSSEPSPLHAFAPNEGSYTVVHAVTDGCGRTDADTVEVAACTVGVEEPVRYRPAPVVEGRTLRFPQLAASAQVELFNATGAVITRSYGDNLVTVPAGLVIWRVTAANGARTIGRAVIP